MGNALDVFQVGVAHGLFHSSRCQAAKQIPLVFCNPDCCVADAGCILPSTYLLFVGASNKFMNQLTRRDSSRNLPWKLSTCAFWVGLPG